MHVTSKCRYLISCMLAVYSGLVAFTSFFVGNSGANVPAIMDLFKRAQMLERIEDPIERDKYGIPLSAYGRMLDSTLPSDARVFLIGVLGEDGRRNLGYHTFFAYYLFPRDVDISLGRFPAFTGLRVDGHPPSSMEELAEAGYSHVIIANEHQQLQLLALRARASRSDHAEPDALIQR